MLKKIEFNNSKKEKIVGILKEKNTAGPLLIIGSGLNSSKEHPATDRITDLLYKMGHSTFSFDFSQSAQGFALKEQVADIQDIIDYFNNYKEFILIAPSFGALSMIIASIQSKKVNGLITINGFFGSWQLKGETLRLYLLIKFFMLFRVKHLDIWRFYKNNYLPEKVKVDTLVIHAKNDESVMIAQSKDFFKKVAGVKEFYILEKGDHHLTKEAYREEIAKVIDQWLNKT